MQYIIKINAGAIILLKDKQATLFIVGNKNRVCYWGLEVNRHENALTAPKKRPTNAGGNVKTNAKSQMEI